ncbi:MAG: cytochrome c oxidase assembly protein [Acidimicrobiales bacterium]
MSSGVASVRPPEPTTRWRAWCLLAAVAVAIMALVPPLSATARHAEYGAALQFSLLAIVLPALLTVGAPWRYLGLAGDGSPDGRRGIIDRVADRRRRHRELRWSLGFIASDLCVVVAWHAPGAVAAVAEHGWMALLEGASLVIFGLGLWLELAASPPLAPRSGYLRRAVLAAFVMWAFWILAYVVGLSNHDFYRNFHHVVGGLSAAADQQISSAVLWFVAAAAFAPVIFWNALLWLKSDEDPDAELLALSRAERRRGLPPVGGTPGGPATTP